MSSKVIIYSASWCGDCRRSKRLLDDLKVDYHLIDVESDSSAAEKVIEINGGYRSIPVIVFQDGTHLTEPSDKALRQKLLDLSLI